MTKLTKEQWKVLLTEAVHAKEVEEKHSQAWEDLFSVVFPDSYPPITIEAYVDGFLKAVSTIYGESAADSVSYFIDEALVKEPPIMCTGKNGKEYDASNMDEYIDFIMSE